MRTKYILLLLIVQCNIKDKNHTYSMISFTVGMFILIIIIMVQDKLDK